jgi:hypothetical protein
MEMIILIMNENIFFKNDMVPKLLIDIARCSNFCNLITNIDNDDSCNDIIDYQRTIGVSEESDFQIPEPWSGDLLNAPILFISSNPAIELIELYPTNSWSDKMIADFFINRFKDRGNKYSWVYKSKVLNKDGTRDDWQHYWAGMKGRAEELLDRKANPGIDYCLTEIVHCKSSNEAGVENAKSECYIKYLDAILNISGAYLIVVVGKYAKEILNEAQNKKGKPIVYLPHPNSREPKKFNDVYSDRILRLKEIVKPKKKSPKTFDVCDFDLPSDDEVKKFIDEQIMLYKAKK